MYIVNESGSGTKPYVVSIGTGTAWVEQFKVYAYNEQEAVDLVADFIEEQEMKGLYVKDFYTLYDCCEVGQTVEEYAEANNLVCCGNHGIYLQVVDIKSMEDLREKGCCNG